MNILSNEQMKQKQKLLLQLYQQGDIKFKFDLSQLLQAKQKKRNLFCFNKLDNQTQLWIQKLVPLHKNVKIVNLQQQQNGLFKVLTFVFLFVIYKNKQAFNQYIKQHLKCSLYSDDIDLLQIKNHSFNKKIKSDHIKAVIATFFIQIQNIITNQLNHKKLKIQDLLAFILQKNDMVMEGFHLFYRIQNASNCIQEVYPVQAIQNLIDYFQIDCRIFNDLYLFAQSGVFLAKIQQSTIVFGRYYENQLYFQQTSDQQTQNIIKPNPQNYQSKFLPKQCEIQKNDVKIFNFLLDTDRNNDQSFMQKSCQASTPSFQNNQQLKFGKKTDRQMDISFSKLKNRLQDQKINQISSKQQQFDSKKQNIIAFNGFSSQNQLRNNKFLCLQSDQQFVQSDAAPTPMLGGGQILSFGKKQQQALHQNSAKNIKQQQQFSIKPKQINNQPNSSNRKTNQLLVQTKQIKNSAIRRQSYQGQNSSQSKSSDNTRKKVQMKTSKNQITVMDGTASQVNIGNLPPNNKLVHEQFRNVRKQTLVQCQKISSLSNCTCHIQKKAKIRLSSQILSVAVTVSNPDKSFDNSSRKISTQIFQTTSRKYIPYNNNNIENNQVLVKNDSNKSSSNLNEKIKTTYKELKDHQKSQQFLNFLKKDKTQLIKKLTQKRHAKHNITNNEILNHKNIQQNHNIQAQKKYGKQSMFVGSYNFQNPQKTINGKNQRNRSITPSGSVDKRLKNRNERSRTPTQPNQKSEASTQGMKLFKNKQKPQFQNTIIKQNAGNLQKHSPKNVNIPPKPPALLKYQPNSQNISSQNGKPINSNIKPYQFYFKR